MGTVTKKDLILRVIERTNEEQELVQEVVQNLFDEMNQQLGVGNRIELRDFGVFSFKKRAARIGHNPRTLEKVPVPAKMVVSFKMGKKMKDAVGELMERKQAEEDAAAAAPADSESPPASETPSERQAPSPPQPPSENAPSDEPASPTQPPTPPAGQP
ncbi:MAG: HU family DNA-binding protein [Planctomycetota bacterium]|jgi:nucleoid DNA-binding protein|nr:HU family DNA-binding protein [Planctomycetota bacterium]MDP7250215.1 HU family DNA-binding protein [Planctomycetota bacterium]